MLHNALEDPLCVYVCVCVCECVCVCKPQSSVKNKIAFLALNKFTFWALYVNKWQHISIHVQLEIAALACFLCT